MTIYRLAGTRPQIAATAYVAAEATLIGEVVVADDVSIWPGATLRGDNEPIRLGAACNVQEGAVLHADAGFPLTLERDVTVGHQAMLHGCTIGECSLIGIQAVVLNGAVIGLRSLVGAGAIVTERKVFPERSLILGAPAKVVRTLGDDEVAALADSAASYAAKGRAYAEQLEAVER